MHAVKPSHVLFYVSAFSSSTILGSDSHSCKPDNPTVLLIRADQLGKQQSWPDASVFLEGGWFPPEQPDMLEGSSSIIEVDPHLDQVIAHI